ncbi:hypothetical protein EYF80_053490 [Liparis tanakae]|uniref:Uncharacterized protein n=1 Tax=Liparis tanakae TaxID=230148 RepID=A0A4Z2F6E6_9TELE|nr:hypothetical protein EYF80_053490 [Liparis tanakae]
MNLQHEVIQEEKAHGALTGSQICSSLTLIGPDSSLLLIGRLTPPPIDPPPCTVPAAILRLTADQLRDPAASALLSVSEEMLNLVFIS